MGQIRIRGGYPLQGELQVQGSKNGVLPILAATLLHKGTIVLRNCPRISDVEEMLEILECQGCVVKRTETIVTVDGTNAEGKPISREKASKMRSSVLLLGPLLGRFGQAEMGYPGGCVIGKRPVDLHVQGMKALGAEIEENEESLMAKGRLKGAEITLPFCSVGATENLILAAAFAEGETVLRGCAMEPEVLGLCAFLQHIGGDIQWRGVGKLVIRGVKSLRDGQYTIPGDRIVAGTYLMAAAATNGKILLRGIVPQALTGQLEVLQGMGVHCTLYSVAVSVRVEETLSPMVVKTGPYPGFPTDLQSQLLAVLASVNGNSRIRETIFENRFGIVQYLRKMGAQLQVQGEYVHIRGVPKLYGTLVTAEDLRGGAALVLAGLEAEGETRVQGISYIARGYESIVSDLKCLGADIEQIEWRTEERMYTDEERQTECAAHCIQTACTKATAKKIYSDCSNSGCVAACHDHHVSVLCSQDDFGGRQ